MLPLIPLLLLFGVTAAGMCWLVEQFAKNAAVRARAKSLRRFFVKACRVTWNVVKLVAQSPGGTIFMEDQASYDDYSDTLDYGETVTYEMET